LIVGQKPGLCSWTRARNQLRACPWGDPQCRFRSNKLFNSVVSWELVGSFISLYPRMSRDPKQPRSMPGGNVIHRLLALLYLWRRFGSLKSFQNRLIVRTNTNLFLWPWRNHQRSILTRCSCSQKSRPSQNNYREAPAVYRLERRDYKNMTTGNSLLNTASILHNG